MKATESQGLKIKDLIRFLKAIEKEVGAEAEVYVMEEFEITNKDKGIIQFESKVTGLGYTKNGEKKVIIIGQELLVPGRK